jgi:hypothetical protein
VQATAHAPNTGLKGIQHLIMKNGEILNLDTSADVGGHRSTTFNVTRKQRYMIGGEIKNDTFIIYVSTNNIVEIINS